MKLNKINIDKPIIVVGDVHGYYNTVVSFIKNNNISNFILLFAGDTGCGFSSKNSLQVQLQKLDKICVKNNINVLMLRGNHDDPSYFNTDEPFEFSNLYKENFPYVNFKVHISYSEELLQKIKRYNCIYESIDNSKIDLTDFINK